MIECVRNKKGLFDVWGSITLNSYGEAYRDKLFSNLTLNEVITVSNQMGEITEITVRKTI